MLVEKQSQTDRFLAQFVTGHLVWLDQAVNGFRDAPQALFGLC
jgi:hypothetical protein